MWLAIIWTNADPIHWHIYLALGGDVLINQPRAVCSEGSKQALWSAISYLFITSRWTVTSSIVNGGIVDLSDLCPLVVRNM